MRALVMWADPASPNLGVQALAHGVADVLRSGAVDFDFVSHRSPMASGPLSIRRMLIAFLYRRSSMRRELASYDLVVDVGEGDSFSSIYGRKRLMQFAISKMLVAKSGTPLVLAPQTVGPFTNRIDGAVAAVAMRSATHIWVRDSASLDRTIRLGCVASRATDLVFAVSRPTVRDRRGPLRLLLNVSGLLWTPNRHVDHADYRHLTYSLIESALTAGWDVFVLPHVHAPGSLDDDLRILTEIRRAFPVVEVEKVDTLSLTRKSIAAADLVVGARMHACLNALSLGVPVVPLAYSDKFEALFGDLGYGYTVDLRRVGAGGLALPNEQELSNMRSAAVSARATADQLVDAFRRGILDGVKLD